MFQIDDIGLLEAGYIALGAIAIALVFNYFTRIKVVEHKSAMAIRNQEGITRIILETETLRGISSLFQERPVRGKKAAQRFAYLRKHHENENEREVETLMDRRTGAISLLVSQIDLPVFTASSSDGHLFHVHTSLRFQLDRNRLMRAFDYANVGEVLMRRLESEVRAEITKRENQKVGSAISTIRQNVKKALADCEDEDAEGFRKWLVENALESGDPKAIRYFREMSGKGAMGVKIVDVDISPMEQFDPPFAQLMRGDAAGAATAEGDGAVMSFGSVMSIPPQHLDNVRDMFMPDFEEAREEWGKLLKIHEKQVEEARAALTRAVTEWKQLQNRRDAGGSAPEGEDPAESIEATVSEEALLAEREKLQARLKDAEMQLKSAQDKQYAENEKLIEREIRAYDSANNSLIKMLEMFKEENIARAHATGKGVVIVPSEKTREAASNVMRGLRGAGKGVEGPLDD